jgi:hypothetical protein
MKTKLVYFTGPVKQKSWQHQYEHEKFTSSCDIYLQAWSKVNTLVPSYVEILVLYHGSLLIIRCQCWILKRLFLILL